MGVSGFICRFEITSMLTTAALSTYQFQANRRKNIERNLSQESLASVLSAGSTNDSEGQEPYDEATSQDDDYATPVETPTEQA